MSEQPVIHDLLGATILVFCVVPYIAPITCNFGEDIHEFYDAKALVLSDIYEVEGNFIGNYYAAHKAEFNLIEPQYHLAQIVVTGAPSQQTGNLQNNKASGDADAKQKIQNLHNRLDSGEDFGAVAMNFSEANTNSNGGDMGFVAESGLHSDSEAYNAISTLKPGQITGILPIYDGAGPGHRIVGYAIYKLIAREPAGQRELNDPRVQQTIRQGLREGHAQLLKNAYFEMLHDDAKVHNYFADHILKEGAK